MKVHVPESVDEAVGLLGAGTVIAGGTHVIPRATATESLVSLRRAGLAHEASRVLSQRIEIEREAGSKPAALARISELSLELSLLKLDDLNDPEAARQEVESALKASPENPAALAAEMETVKQ